MLHHPFAMTGEKLLDGDLTGSVIGAFFEVYNTLGYGFLEHVYAMALERELRARGHEVGREVVVMVFYKDHELTNQRIDMIVDRRLIVEIKAVERLPPAAHRQIQSYLHSTLLQVGLLLHFGPRPKFYRFVSTSRRKSAFSA